MTINNILEVNLCLDNIVILKGSIQGAQSTFQNPIKNVSSLWDFEKNPIFTPYVVLNSYIIISKYKNNDAPINNPYYNIQIIYLLNNKNNLLELGTAILYDNKLKINMTETSSLLGEIIYDCKKNIFKISRFSLPPNSIFIDSGDFNLISIAQFEIETGIKI